MTLEFAAKTWALEHGLDPDEYWRKHRKDIIRRADRNGRLNDRKVHPNARERRDEERAHLQQLDAAEDIWKHGGSRRRRLGLLEKILGL